MQYLIAYDQEALAHSLCAARAVRTPREGRRFIEKIVQYPFAVPPLLTVQKDEWLTTHLREVVHRNRPYDDVDSMHRVSDARELFRSTLGTPRAIKKFIAQLDFDLALHLIDEIDDEDVILLALLRTVYPSVYELLTAYQDKLVSGTASGTGAPGEARWPVTELLNSAGLDKETHSDDRHRATRMLMTLFPMLTDVPAQEVPEPQSKRICRPEYFRRYFAMGILDGHDIADATVYQAIERACDGDALSLRELLSADSPELVTLALDKTERMYGTVIDQVDAAEQDTATLALATAIVPVRDHVAALTLGPSRLLDSRDRVIQWTGAHLLRRLSDETSGADVENALRAADAANDPTRLDVIFAAATPTHGRPRWLGELIEYMLTPAVTALRENLNDHNNAAFRILDHELNHFMYFFVLADNFDIDLAPVRNELREAMAAHEFELDELAARCVYPVGLRLKEDRSLLAALAHDQDDWYDREPAILEHEMEASHSWAARRAFATGRFDQPGAE